MTGPSLFAEISSLAGDPARARMLQALMDGRALTARELADAAGITPQTASGHLAQLTAAGLLAVEKQGRHRYHRLATPSVAGMLEGIMQVAAELEAPRRRRVTVGPRDLALRAARTCYDHLAGQLGVALADALQARGCIELDSDAGRLTEAGADFFIRLGIEISDTAAARSRRLLCRPCLDWSERRPHIAGRLGAALCAHALSANWVRRIDGTRALTVTAKGQNVLRERFGLSLA